MRSRKKIGIAALFFVPLFLVLVGVVGLYKNQELLTRKALSSINEGLLGELVIEKSRISPFVNFPYISVDLKNVTFFETKSKDTAPIYEAKDIYIGFSLIDVLLGNYRVKSIQISDGQLRLVKTETGEINLLNAKNITDASSEEKENDSFSFDLKQLTVRDFTISYTSQTSSQDIRATISQLQSSLKMDRETLFLDLQGDLILNVLEGQNPTFFSDKRVNLDWQLNYYLSENRLSVMPSQLTLEEAHFTLEGTVDIEDDLNTDLKLYGEKPDFSLFAAFAPEEVAEALKNYQNEGNIFFLGTINGKAIGGHSPAIAVEFGCENAYFVNTRYDQRVDKLNFSGFYTNGKEKSLKTSEIRLQNVYAKPEEGAFQGKLVIRDFEDPYVNVELHADLDLEFLGQFFEVEGLKKLKGQVILDMDLDEIVEMDIPKMGLAKLKEGIDSELTIRNLSFLIPGFSQPVTNANGLATMKDGEILLDYLNFNLGDSDFNFKGAISDFPAIFHGLDEEVKIALNLSSNNIYPAQLLAADSALSNKPHEEISDLRINLEMESNAKELVGFQHLPKGVLKVEDFYAKLKNYPHAFHDFDAAITIGDSRLEVNHFAGEIDGSDFQISGRWSNYPKWFQPVKSGKSSFDFIIDSRQLNLKDLLTYNGENYLPESYSKEEISGLHLTANLDLHYDTVFQAADLTVQQLEGKLSLHPLALQSVKGRIHYENGNTLVENFGGHLGKSDVVIDMAYFSGKDSSLQIRPNSFHLSANTLDLDALMNFNTVATRQVAHDSAFNIFDLPFSNMEFTANIGKLNYHTYWLEEVEAAFHTTKAHFLHVDSLSLRTARGKLGMKGYFNGSDPSNIYFYSTMKAELLDLDQLMIKFENFGQDFLINENLHGKVSGTITSKFLVHPDLTPIIEKSEAQMDLTVYQGSLVNFTPFQAMSSYFKNKNLNLVRFDTLQNTFDLKNGILHIPKMTVNSSLGFIELSGMQGLDLNMDYFIRIPLGLVTQAGVRSLFGGKSSEQIDSDKEDAIVYRDQDRRVRFVNINVKGTPDDYEFSLGKGKNR